MTMSNVFSAVADMRTLPYLRASDQRSCSWRAGLVFHGPGGELFSRLRDHGVDLFLGHLGRSNDRDQAADRDVIVGLDNQRPDNPGPRRLERTFDLVGGDLSDFLALLELVTHRHKPFGDFA